MNKYIIKRTLISVVYPNRCPFCNEIIKPYAFFHGDCLKLINVYQNSGISTFYCGYNENSKQFIYQAKYKSDGYAISAAAKLLYTALAENGVLSKVDLITAIPPKKASLKKRGYCFPEYLAKEIAQMANIKYSRQALRLAREYREQKGLNADERAENVKGAFLFGKEKLVGKRVLLIDDICTTGATLNEAKAALLKSAEAVYIAAFAKTEINDNL